MADEADPIAAMLAIDDEAERGRSQPEADINVDPPADKAEQERDEAGKFKGKDGEKPDAKDAEKKAEEPKKDEPKVEKRDDTVPLAKYLAEKNQLKKDLEARDLTIKQFNEKLAALEAKLAPKPVEQPEPDFVEDPKGYVDHKLTAALKGIEEANKKAETAGSEAKETAERATEAVQVQRFFADLQQHEARFVQQNPDYHDALAHIRGIRMAQMREFNPEVTAEEVYSAIRQEETQLAINLARQGRDPVQVAYNLAKHFGYQPKAKADTKVDAKQELKLPDPPASKRLPPDQTLGSGAGGDTPVYKEGENDPVDIALASLFKKRA